MRSPKALCGSFRTAVETALGEMSNSFGLPVAHPSIVVGVIPGAVVVFLFAGGVPAAAAGAAGSGGVPVIAGAVAVTVAVTLCAAVVVALRIAVVIGGVIGLAGFAARRACISRGAGWPVPGLGLSRAGHLQEVP